MKTMSISLQDALYERLKQSVPSKKISKFVSHAIAYALELKEQELIKAYKESENYKNRKTLLQEWDEIDTNYLVHTDHC